MPELPQGRHRKLKILHVIRAPVGGLFRHVLDLAREQAARGHSVGLIADSSTGGPTADRVLAELTLTLGLRRFPMRRNPHPSDVPALFKMLVAERSLRPDVVHGHGSKGALYARAVAALPGHHALAIRAYTPHGGSLHYAPGSALNAVYMGIERWLARRSDLILFESAYIEARYKAMVGQPPALSRIVLNGVSDQEFEPVVPVSNAADFVYVGELRAAKGIDVLLRALASTREALTRPVRLVLVGAGPDRAVLDSLARDLGLAQDVTFAGPMPARQAFALGRVLVMPSRAESLPYVALEAAAAQVPIIATRVGGLPEIFGPFSSRLIAAGDWEVLRDALLAQLAMGADRQHREAQVVAAHVHARFRIGTMVDGVLAGYGEAIAAARAKPAFVFRPELIARG